ncbi:MAG TPA: hypothetical protein QGH10_17635 [Armatimonadota bacterium]|nr:hypothetical protein [Armatimonadota bacterium]
MSIAFIASVILLPPHAPAVAQGGSQVAQHLTFTGLGRQPYAWYIAPGGPLAEASVCVNHDKAGRPAGVSAVFPSNLKKMGLHFRVNQGIKKGRLRVSFWHNDVEERSYTFGIPGRKYWTCYVTPKKSKTFDSGLYTFELVLDGELLGALDVAVISSEQLPPSALAPPTVTDVPPPPRLLAGGVGVVSGPVEARVASGPVESSTVAVLGGPQGTRAVAPAYPPPGGNGGGASAGGERRGDLVDDLIASARNRSTDEPERTDGVAPSKSGGGSLLGSVLSSGSPTSAAAKVVGRLFGFGKEKTGPTDFIVKRTQASQRLAQRIVASKHMGEVMHALGGRRPITHAVAAVSDTKNFNRCVLLLPLTAREGDPTLMALLVIDDVSVAVNDAPLVAEKGFEFSFKSDRVYALAILVDPATAVVQVLGKNGETLVAGPAHLAAPEAQAQDPFASIHQVISQDTTGDRAVAICSLTPGLNAEACVSAVFPLLLSRERM